MKLQKLAGATAEIWQVFIRDSSSTTGAGLTGLVFNTASLTAYYHRDTDTTATAISLVTMTVGTFTSSGFKEIDATHMPGWYQFCPPNAALAAGAKSCSFHLQGAANMAPLPIEVQLLAVNVDDAVRMGMTALPNAAAEAAGGLYTRGSGAGQINQDANGRIDVSLKAILGTTLTETAGQIAAGFKKLFDVAVPVFTLTSVNQTGDSYARLGAPAGASHAADVAAVKTDTAAIKTKTDSLTYTVAGMVDSNVIDWKGAAAPAMTGDAYARIGAAGAGLTALGDARLAHLDVDVSSRSTYAGADTSGTTTLLARLTNTRAGLLDNLDAGISASFTALQSHGDGAWATATGFSTLDAADVNTEVDTALADAGVTTVRMGHLDADVSTRLASGAYTAPDNAGIASIDGKATTILAGVVAIDSKTANLPSDPADESLIIDATNGILAVLGTPAGASISADIAGLPSASDNADAVLAATYEGGETVQDHFRLARASLYGKANGLAGSTVHFRDAADSKNRISATVDSDGNRSAVTTDAT